LSLRLSDKAPLNYLHDLILVIDIVNLLYAIQALDHLVVVRGEAEVLYWDL
jgi:hypothetical protein